jgi:hypothetical protein
MLLEELRVAHLSRNSLAFNGNQSFITSGVNMKPVSEVSKTITVSIIRGLM